MKSIIFILLACVFGVLIPNAPNSPDEAFISQCLALVFLTNLVVFVIKLLQPKPVNWLTVEVLFTVGFSLIHFGYFTYWITGYFGTGQQLWNAGSVRVPHVVCQSVAMFGMVLNLFLAGYHLIKTKRFYPMINEVKPSRAVAKAWGTLGRILVRIGFLCYLAFIVLVGPAVFFGNYAGTGNLSTTGNVFYQLGQVLLVSGITIGVVSRERFIASGRSKFSILQIGFVDLFLVLITLAAIGIHGDRSTLLTVGVALAIAYSEYVKPFRMTVLIAGAFGVIFLIGLILINRSGRDVEFSFVDNLNHGMVNMGASALCGFVAVEYAENNLSYGKKQILPLLGIMPFGRRLAGITSNPDTSSAMLFTLLIQGKTGRGVAGTGTSAFADFYLDFGLFGTSFLFLLLGFFSKWMENKARHSTNILWQVALVNFASFIAICSRYSIAGGLIRYVIYGVFYTVVISYLFGIPFKDKLTGDRAARTAFLRRNR